MKVVQLLLIVLFWVTQVLLGSVDVHVVPHTHLDAGWIVSFGDMYER